MALEEWEADALKALEKNGGNQSAAAKSAGVHRTTIGRYLATDENFRAKFEVLTGRAVRRSRR